MDLAMEEFTEFFYKNYCRWPGARTAGTWSGLGISDDALMAIIQQEAVKYPQLNLTTDIPDSTFARIKRDFPEITTAQHVYEHAEDIAFFYNDLLRHDVSLRVSKSRGGRIMYDLNPKEEQLKISRPHFALMIRAAKGDAELFTDHHYGGGATNVDDNTGNAYKHSVWNASSLYRFISSGYSKVVSMDWVRKFTSAHEYDRTGTQLERTPASAMDLHNNLVGRTWFIGRTRFGIFGLRDMPSLTAVRDGIHTHVMNTVQIRTMGSIVSMYSTDENEAWARLEMWGETPHHASISLQ